MRGRLIAILAVFVFVWAMLGAVQAGYSDAVTTANNETSIDNETFTVDHDTALALDESNRDVVYDNETVVKFNDSLIEQPGNYTWDTVNGTVTVVSGSTLTDGAEAGISYNVTEPSGEQTLTRDVALLWVGDLGGVWPLLAGLALLMGGVGVVGRMVS